MFIYRSVVKKYNEWLEFFGDVILGMVIGEIFYKCFIDVLEGKFICMCLILVKGDILVELVCEVCMGELLLLGLGELKSGGYRWSFILVDVVEVLFGVIYFDFGME